MKPTTIVAIRATPVTVPLEAPLLHSNGAHWGRFVRTIVEVETSDGYVGLGELGGGGESAVAAVTGLLAHLSGHNVFELEALRFKICNPTASLYNNRTQVHAAIEFACLDIIGQKLGVPVYDLLGGKLRETVPFASYRVFRYANPVTGEGEVRTSEQLVACARALKSKHGFRAHKLKGGVYPPVHELACYRALAEAFPDDSFRYDPNSALSLEEAIHFGRAIADLRNDYFEDPVWGMPAVRRLRELVPIATATNTVVVDFEQLAANIEMRAVDVILLDTTFWGGIRPCIKAAGVCEIFGLGVAVQLVGRAGHPARDDATSGRGTAESELCRRRALSPSGRRRCRRRQAGLPRWRDRRAHCAGSGCYTRSRQVGAVPRTVPRAGHVRVRAATPAGRVGSRWSRIAVGRIRPCRSRQPLACGIDEYTGELNGMIGEFEKRGVSTVIASTDSKERAAEAKEKWGAAESHRGVVRNNSCRGTSVSDACRRCRLWHG